MSWADGIFLFLILSLVVCMIVYWILDDHPPEGPD